MALSISSMLACHRLNVLFGVFFLILGSLGFVTTISIFICTLEPSNHPCHAHSHQNLVHPQMKLTGGSDDSASSEGNVAKAAEVDEKASYFSNANGNSDGALPDGAVVDELASVEANASEDPRATRMSAETLRPHKLHPSMFKNRKLLEELKCESNYCDENYDYCPYFGQGCFCSTANACHLFY